MKAVTKTLGSSGQISLGKKYAGRTVLVEEMEEGVWIIKTAQTIPDSEFWLHTPEVQAKLRRAIARAEKNPPRETDWEEFEAKVKAHLDKSGKRK
jgi:hypothetical protein